jgi:4-diphosphocytidyl-2-C-methyl-D-erythritol kinase
LTQAPSARALVLPAYGKLNLDLRVLGAQPDGYHLVSTHLQAISLHDLLMVEPASATSLVGGCQDDLVLRAQAALEAAAGRPLPAGFRLVKRIPVGAGFGGGSSDAAVALQALQRLYGLDLDLHGVATRLGADVPFFLSGGAAVAGSRGEQLDPVAPSRGWYALAWPGLSVATASVYRMWDRIGGDGDNHLGRAAVAVEPRLAEFAAMLGDGWQMTGSGSAFFRPCPTRAEADMAIAGLDCWARVARGVGAHG